jgi:hypothetical protein
MKKIATYMTHVSVTLRSERFVPDVACTQRHQRKVISVLVLFAVSIVKLSLRQCTGCLRMM